MILPGERTRSRGSISRVWRPDTEVRRWYQECGKQGNDSEGWDEALRVERQGTAQEALDSLSHHYTRARDPVSFLITRISLVSKTQESSSGPTEIRQTYISPMPPQ